MTVNFVNFHTGPSGIFQVLNSFHQWLLSTWGCPWISSVFLSRDTIHYWVLEIRWLIRLTFFACESSSSYKKTQTKPKQTKKNPTKKPKTKTKQNTQTKTNQEVFETHLCFIAQFFSYIPYILLIYYHYMFLNLLSILYFTNFNVMNFRVSGS